MVYFLAVKPYTHVRERNAAKVESTTRDCPECLSKIPKSPPAALPKAHRATPI
jgi:large conductance mechanosensitive channel